MLYNLLATTLTFCWRFPYELCRTTISSLGKKPGRLELTKLINGSIDRVQVGDKKPKFQVAVPGAPIFREVAIRVKQLTKTTAGIGVILEEAMTVRGLNAI